MTTVSFSRHASEQFFQMFRPLDLNLGSISHKNLAGFFFIEEYVLKAMNVEFMPCA